MSRDGLEPWRLLPAAQQPQWPDGMVLRGVLDQLRCSRPLVLPAECDQLRDRMAQAARGRAFVLQGGDCAETFDGGPGGVGRTLRTLRQMASILQHATAVPVVQIGRFAGQYAKPRSSATETRAGTTLPAYRGDAVNGREFTAAARTPDATRLHRAYCAAAATVEVVRGIGGGEVYTSHEALILDYEAALTRPDPRSGTLYGCSGHLLWIGERTRQLDGGHVAFASQIGNPAAVKLGPTVTPHEVGALVDRLDPDRRPGRLTFIARMGAPRVRDLLPDLVQRVAATGAEVGWMCDPMHGNTAVAPGGQKTRRFDDVLDEMAGFFEVHRALNTHPAGVHLELTGRDVTECVGGRRDPVRPADLHLRYETACDPRLNRAQSLELASLIAELHRDAGRRRSRRPAADPAVA